MHLDGHLSELGLHQSSGGSAPANSLMPSALSLSGEYAHPPPVLSLPPNCSLITTTAVTLGGWWVGGCANAPHTPPHHPATTSSPSSPRNFFVPPTFWRLPRVYRRLQPAPLNLSCCLSTTSCLAADSNSVLTLVEICRLALALGWLVLYVPSSFLAEFQCSHASETDLVDATCLVVKACNHARR